MVRDECPGQEEGGAEKDMLKETLQPEENSREIADEDHRNDEMEWSEEYSDQITEHLEGDTYTVGKLTCVNLTFEKEHLSSSTS